jgi:hypothetical protein
MAWMARSIIIIYLGMSYLETALHSVHGVDLEPRIYYLK